MPASWRFGFLSIAIKSRKDNAYTVSIPHNLTNIAEMRKDRLVKCPLNY